MSLGEVIVMKDAGPPDRVDFDSEPPRMGGAWRRMHRGLVNDRVGGAGKGRKLF